MLVEHVGDDLGVARYRHDLRQVVLHNHWEFLAVELAFFSIVDVVAKPAISLREDSVFLLIPHLQVLGHIPDRSREECGVARVIVHALRNQSRHLSFGSEVIESCQNYKQ